MTDSKRITMGENRRIPLTQGKFALVDVEDFEWLSQWKWTYLGAGTNNYAYRHSYDTGKRITIVMHRKIMKAPTGLDVDHINRDGLDNRRVNLRVVDRTQNNFNTGLHRNNRSGYRGVSWSKQAKSWRAYIGGSKNRRELGCYKSLTKAVAVRKAAEREIILCA